MVGKILARALLNRLKNLLTPLVVPESIEKSAIDILFHLHQVPKKYLEQNMPRYAFDIVPKKISGEYLKFRCSEKFINLTASLMMKFKPVYCTEVGVSPPSNSTSPLWWKEFLATGEGVYIQMYHNSNLNIVSYFKAKNKTECVIEQKMLRRELYTDSLQHIFV